MDLEFNIGEAVGAGALATLIMTVVMYMGKFMLPRQMPMDILYMLGSMMSRDKMPAYGAGTMMHMGAGIGFALIHNSERLSSADGDRFSPVLCAALP